MSAAPTYPDEAAMITLPPINGVTPLPFATSCPEDAPAVSPIDGRLAFHAVAALRRTGQDFTARMIGAEALSRT